MTGGSDGPLLTLEPLIEAVREGVEVAGWRLSGLQKTTSHEFEGRWEGESTRSAYLFFHLPDGWESVSVDAYLDETSRGLQGNLALVLAARPLGELGDPTAALALMGAAAAEILPTGHTTPLSLRVRLPRPDADPRRSDVEVRFKLHIPGTAIEAGPRAVAALASTTLRAYETLVSHPRIAHLLRLG